MRAIGWAWSGWSTSSASTSTSHFVDRFLSVDELAVLLARTDLYVTPYRSPEQIVSGALTFAVAAGCPVVSTPYHYAENLLGSGAGVLVPFGDVPRLSAAVLDLLDTPGKLDAARAEARRVGADLPWASVGKVTLEVLAEAGHDIGPSPRRAPAGPDRPAAAPARPSAAAGRRRRHHPARQRHRAEPVDRLLRRRRGPAGHRRPAPGPGGPTTPRTDASSDLVAGLPGPRLGAGDVPACATSWTTGGAGWTSRTSATTSAGRSGRWARWSRRQPAAAGGPHQPAPADRDGPGAGPPDRARASWPSPCWA